MPKKTEKLSEQKVSQTYEVVKGFNVSDGTRFDVGAKKPSFVFEKDFDPKDWKALLEMGAVVLTPEAVEAKKELKEGETIVFEKVEK